VCPAAGDIGSKTDFAASAEISVCWSAVVPLRQKPLTNKTFDSLGAVAKSIMAVDNSFNRPIPRIFDLPIGPESIQRVGNSKIRATLLSEREQRVTGKKVPLPC
jgi:hypothetical protein